MIGRDENPDYVGQAKVRATIHANMSYTLHPTGFFTPNDFNVIGGVWSERSWLVYLETDRLDPAVYKITYNATKDELLVDIYRMV